MNKSPWWPVATTKDRLRQIDAALSIGLTCEEARIICECEKKSSFTSFCAYHGRRFARDEVSTSAKLRENNIIYIRRKRGFSELERDGAFDVFDRRDDVGSDVERAFR